MGRHTRYSGIVVQVALFVVALLLLLLMIILAFARLNMNLRFTGEGVGNSDYAGNGGGSLGGCTIIPEDWRSHFDQAASASGVDPALLVAIFSAGEHRYYGGSWPAYVENPPYATGLNPQIHDGGDNGYVRGPAQFKEQTFQNSRKGVVASDATKSRFGTPFLVEPYIEQMQPSLTVAGNYLKELGGRAGADELTIKKAIFGYLSGGGAKYRENHWYVDKVFPAYQEYSQCLGGDGDVSDEGVLANGNYAPVLEPAILKKFIPFRPHHGNPSDPAVDIGVPNGTRVFAFTAGRVTSVFRGSAQFRPGSGRSGTCGTGLNMIGDDGAPYQYCHFTYGSLAPEVVVGARLTAGQYIGLTDHTGSSTGPHLHFGSPGLKTYQRAQTLRDRLSGTVK